jgi:branched-chain amino acid transport system substrate-binding protein
MGTKRALIGAVAAAILTAGASAGQAQELKVGYLISLSGKVGIIGKHMQDAFTLGVEHSGGKLGGVPTTVIFEDDQQDPTVGKQKVEKLLDKDRVHFVSGIIWSNVMMAIYKPIVDSQTFLLSSNAGPSPIAGKLCSPYFFTTSWQNDTNPEAMGQYMQSKGIKKVFLMAPNYQAGKDMLAGFKRFYKGEVAGEVYTKFPDQLDFAAELAQVRNAKPDAVYVFYPGAFGVSFVKQYSQSGLKKDVPLYHSYTVDGTTFDAIGEDAVGTLNTMFWGVDLDNPVNKKFVADFVKKYGYEPSFYAAQAYDSALAIDHVIKAVKGKMTDKPAIRAAFEKGGIPSVRGTLNYNTNHFPIQNFYLHEVVKKPDGKISTKIVSQVFKDHKDAYAAECKM